MSGEKPAAMLRQLGVDALDVLRLQADARHRERRGGDGQGAEPVGLDDRRVAEVGVMSAGA